MFSAKEMEVLVNLNIERFYPEIIALGTLMFTWITEKKSLYYFYYDSILFLANYNEKLTNYRTCFKNYII